MPETDLTALLAGAGPPPDAPAGLRSAAEVLAALRAQPAADELAGEQAALSQFRQQQAGVSVLERRSRRRRPVMLVAALAATAAVTLAVIGLSLDAYHGGLPGPVQRIAHDVFGSPGAGSEQSAGASPAPSGAPASPRGSGPPAGHHQPATGVLAQLCASYEGTHGHGGGVGRSTAFHELTKAAGSAGKVAVFCARLAHSGAPPPPPSPPPHKGKHHSHPNGNSNPQGNGNPPGNGGGDPQGNGNGAGAAHKNDNRDSAGNAQSNDNRNSAGNAQGNENRNGAGGAHRNKHGNGAGAAHKNKHANGAGAAHGNKHGNGGSPGNENSNGNTQGIGIPGARWPHMLVT